MAVFEDTNRGRLSRVREVTTGTTPATPAFDITRIVSSDLNYQKNTTQSNELRADRMLSAQPQVSAQTLGGMPIELSAVSYTDLIEAALFGTIENLTPTPIDTFSITPGGDGTCELDGGTGNKFAGIDVGDFIYITGSAAPTNDGFWRISAKTDDNTITINDPGDVTVADASDAAVINTRRVRNAGDLHTYSIETLYQNNNISQLFRGQRVGGLELAVASEQIVTGAFNFEGQDMLLDETGTPPWAVGGSYANPPTTPPFNATANVGQLWVTNGETGLWQLFPGVTQAINFSLTNNLRTQSGVGYTFPAGIGVGRQVITGDFTRYLQDFQFLKDTIADRTIALSFQFTDELGNAVHFYFPRVTLTNDTVNLSGGIDSDVQDAVTWSALAFDPASEGGTDDPYQVQVSFGPDVTS